MVVSRDDLRLAFYNTAFGPPIDEGYITNVEMEAIAHALMFGYDVISDNTNLQPYLVENLLVHAKDYNAVLYFDEIEIDVQRALQRNAQRAAEGGRFVPPEVVNKQYDAFYKHRAKVQEIFDRYTIGDTRIQPTESTND